MHLRVLVNGTVEQVDKWKRDLAAQSVPWGEAKDGLRTYFQLGVRTIELIDIVFPEEHLNAILNIVKPCHDGMYVDNKKTRYPWLLKFKKMLGKIMRLDPIPEYKSIPHWLDKEVVAVHGIGLKKDLRDKDGKEFL